MDTSDILCMLISKLPGNTRYRWNKRALIIKRQHRRKPELEDSIDFLTMKFSWFSMMIHCFPERHWATILRRLIKLATIREESSSTYEKPKWKWNNVKQNYEVPNDKNHLKFVYFIVAICRDTLKSFLSQFLKWKAIWNFTQSLVSNTNTKYQIIRYLLLRCYEKAVDV